MKYYLIAGEASGDLHGANLMKAIKKWDNRADFRFFGGDLMASEGGFLVCHYRQLAFMGLFDVIANLRTILGNLNLCKEDIRAFSPDALILIDYPGFNLRIAKFSFEKAIKTFYFIPPKVWVWKKSRIKKLKKYIHKIFVIFPFELEFYALNGIEVEYFGNPLKDSVAEHRSQAFPENNLLPEELDTKLPLIALLCGSRKHEVKRCLPEMVKAAVHFPDHKFVVAGVSALDPALYNEILSGTSIGIVVDKTYSLLEKSYAAVVTSGTATLETALFNVPQVVVYKIGPLTYFLGRLLVRIKYFSLVNIIAGKEVVKELLQVNLSDRIREELGKIIHNENYRMKIQDEYEKIDHMIGEPGVADKIALRIVQLAE
jgi:lipid-A-disaccharide synthase